MGNDLYIHRFEEVLASISILPSLQSELDQARRPDEPAMDTDEFRRELLAKFSALLEREQLSDPNVEFNTVAAMTINTFAKQFSPEREAEEDAVLSEIAQRQLREIFDGIMTRVLNARFRDPGATEMDGRENVLNFSAKRK